MNGTEQRAHTKKTDVLAEMIAETQAAVIERFESVEARAQQFRDRLSETRARVTAVEDQATSDRAHNRTIAEKYYIRFSEIEAVTRGTLWQRVRWFLTGR